MSKEEMVVFMSWFKWVLMGILLLLVAGMVAYSIFREKKCETSRPGKLMAVTGIMGAISIILYCTPILNFNLPFLPSFLSVHLDEIPIFIVGYAYGPLASIIVTFLKTIAKLPMTSTATVGEFGDFLFTLAFVLPSVILYDKRRKLSSVFIGFGVSLTVQVLVAMVANVYVMIPFYEFFYGISEADLLKMCQAVNPGITDVGWTYATLAVLPMNLIKDSIVLVIVFFVYKGLHRFLKLSWRKGKEATKKEGN